MDGKWNSRRSPVYARNGMVATSQPLATEIGLGILKNGGNAADAAVGIAAALNLVQPMSTGLGGDAFVLFYDAKQKKVKGVNASGRCASGLSLELLEGLGYNEQNRPVCTSPIWVTVPGAAAGWIDTIEQFGSKKLSLEQIFAPTIKLAQDGFPVAPVSSHLWETNCSGLFSSSPNSHELLINKNGTLLAPKPGEIFTNPYFAQTLKDLAAGGKVGFYEGRIGQAIVDVLKELGGYLTLDDLKRHVSTFDEPIHVNYHGVDVYEIPPNGQGITALIALNILKGYDLSLLKHGSVEHLHTLIEATRLAFADTRHYVADPTYTGVSVPIKELLSEEYAKIRRALINPSAANTDIKNGFPTNASNTVYFNVVDSEGNACSFINSVYMNFGTCIIPKGCGFVLHNRGHNFSLDPNHVNCLAPNKRPYHTIIPGMALKNNELWAAFGVMGGFMQPQGHVQVLSNMIDFGMNPQEAVDAPRFLIDGGTQSGRILLEDGIQPSVRDQLASMGHVDPTLWSGWNRLDFGLGQIIRRDSETGVLCAGSDPRNDGMAIGY